MVYVMKKKWLLSYEKDIDNIDCEKKWKEDINLDPDG